MVDDPKAKAADAAPPAVDRVQSADPKANAEVAAKRVQPKPDRVESADPKNNVDVPADKRVAATPSAVQSAKPPKK
jgi:hypothetical protein